MRVTVVPNRNAIMLSVAFGVAASRGYDAVAIGVHTGDHAIYPDCRAEFIQAFDRMERVSLGEWWRVGLMAPFVHMTKADIVTVGDDIGIPFADTWSCYEGGEVHCGRCGTCVERKEAFGLAGVPDPTVYEV
jgi:7-cyano-7-deazaguanine synthase